MRNPFKVITKYLKNLITKEKPYVQKVPDSASKSGTVNSRKRQADNPAWWRRLYNLESRSKVPSTNLQPVKSFGNFTPHRDFAKPKWYKESR